MQNPCAWGVFFSISISPDFRADGDSWRLAASGLPPRPLPPPALDLKSGLMDMKSGLTDLKSGLMDMKSGLMDLKSGLMDLKSGLMAFLIN